MYSRTNDRPRTDGQDRTNHGEGDGDGELSERELVSRRTFHAPRERVFRAYSDPARLARWWGPSGYTNTFHVFDMRPGGVWRSTMHAPDGTDYPSESVFVEIVEPERIVFRHVSAGHPYEMAISLEEAPGGGTTMTWRMRHPTRDECARIRAVVVAANEENFDRLAAELAR
jgi:uncharacterized protein YndB with AHSA1/START domain